MIAKFANGDEDTPRRGRRRHGKKAHEANRRSCCLSYRAGENRFVRRGRRQVRTSIWRHQVTHATSSVHDETAISGGVRIGVGSLVAPVDTMLAAGFVSGRDVNQGIPTPVAIPAPMSIAWAPEGWPAALQPLIGVGRQWWRCAGDSGPRAARRRGWGARHRSPGTGTLRPGEHGGANLGRSGRA